MTRLKIKPQGLCVFCGRPGVSKEHVWPQWMHDIIPKGPEAKHRRVTYIASPSANRLTTEMERERQGDVHTFQVRAVCQRHCNSGWMSNLEQRAKPILTPLIKGNAIGLGRREQELVATWVTKTAMMMEYSVRRDVSSSQEQRNFLMDNLEPPAGWRISIAHYQGEAFRLAAIRKSAALSLMGTLLDNRLKKSMNSQAITFGMGSLLVNVMATSVPLLTFDVDPKFEPYIPQIWPFQKALSWPTGNVLNDADVRIISNGFNRMLTSDPDHFDRI